MANTFTDIYQATVSRDCEEILRNRAVMPRLVATDYSPEIASFGQSITANFPASFTAADKVVGTAFTVQAATVSGVTMTLNKHKVVPFQVDDVEAAMASPENLVEKLLGPAIDAVVKAVDVDLLGLNSDIISAGYTVGTGGTALTLDKINDADAQLNSLGVDVMDRFLVLSATSKQNLQDPSVAVNSIIVKMNEAGGPGVLDQSRLNPLYGFTPYLDQNVLTSTVCSTVSQLNLAFNRRAFGLIVRRLPLPKNADMALYVTDPISGLELRVIITFDHAELGTIASVDMLYGVATLDAKKACVVYG